MAMASDYGNPVGSKTVRDMVTFREVVAIGSSGAASQDATTAKSTGYDTAFTCTRDASNAGIYYLVFPKGKRAWIDVALYSPLKTVVGWALIALDAQAGTATIHTLAGTNAAVATDPASGNKLFITIDVER